MTFGQIPVGARVFLDANSLVYHFTFQQAIAALPQPSIQVIPVTQRLLEAATLVSKQFELLTGDSLIVAVMQAHGLTHLASNDADFDRVSWLTRMHQFDLLKFVLIRLLSCSPRNRRRRGAIASPGVSGSCELRGGFGAAGKSFGFGIQTTATWFGSLGVRLESGEVRRRAPRHLRRLQVVPRWFRLRRGDHIGRGIRRSVASTHFGRS